MYPIKMPSFDFKNKSVIITGAGSGIGRAAAMEFANYGASVAVADIELERAERVVNMIKENEGRAIAVRVDISKPEDVEQMMQAVESAFGGVDILIANAGIGGATLPLLSQPVEEFDRVIAVNLRGAYICCTAAAERMIKQGRGGRIVLTSSIAAIEGGGNHGPYGAAKGALCSLVRTMGREWAEYKITVNAVCPGLTDTGISEALKDNPQQMNAMLAKIPLGRMARPEEIASLMLYLSTEAAGFITGVSVIADGGATTGG